MYIYIYTHMRVCQHMCNTTCVTCVHTTRALPESLSLSLYIYIYIYIYICTYIYIYIYMHVCSPRIVGEPG